MIPVIQVSHLPTSASFYAAIFQSFGVRFLSASTTSSGRFMEFGFPAFSPTPSEIVCILHEEIHPRPDTIRISSVVVGTIEDFHERGLKAADFPISHSLTHAVDLSVAKITDFDGNMIEATYQRRPSLPVLDSVTLPKQDQRVLNWQHEVARSINSTEEDPLQARRQVPRASTLPLPARSYKPVDLGRGHLDAIVPGMSNQALIGTILGAAAGAAVAYAMAKSEAPSWPFSQRTGSYHDHRAMQESTSPYFATRPDVTAARINEIEQKMDNIWSPQDPSTAKVRRLVSHAPRREGEDSLTRVTSAAARRSARSTARTNDDSSRQFSEVSRHSSRHKSIAPPKALATTNRSMTASSTSRHSRRSNGASEESTLQPRTYVSARSSASPAKPQSRSTNPPRSERSTRDKKSSSIVSARLVALPESVVGSVAPSDSISCVGSRRER